MSPALPGVCVCVWNFSKEVKLVPSLQPSALALIYSDDMIWHSFTYLILCLALFEQLRLFDLWFVAFGTRFWYLALEYSIYV